LVQGFFYRQRKTKRISGRISKTGASRPIYYDPNAHPDFRGSTIREIYVFSNDSIDFEKKG